MVVYLHLLGKLHVVWGKQTFKKHCTAAYVILKGFSIAFYVNTADGDGLDNLFTRNSIFLPEQIF